MRLFRLRQATIGARGASAPHPIDLYANVTPLGRVRKCWWLDLVAAALGLKVPASRSAANPCHGRHGSSTISNRHAGLAQRELVAESGQNNMFDNSLPAQHCTLRRLPRIP